MQNKLAKYMYIHMAKTLTVKMQRDMHGSYVIKIQWDKMDKEQIGHFYKSNNSISIFAAIEVLL